MKVRTDIRAGNVINDASATIQNAAQDVSGYVNAQKDRLAGWSQHEVDRMQRIWNVITGG